MVVTGAGPGIMAAGMEGAGRERSLGVNIRLPHEQGANEFIAQDPKLVEMRYFFTRKLMLIKESDGYAVLPGGFGTLDEAFELLTLLQTGKAQPAPLVLLDVPAGTYWQGWQHFLDDRGRRGRVGLARGPIAVRDHVRRRRGGGRAPRLLPQLPLMSLGRRPPRDAAATWPPRGDQLAGLNDRFADIVASGSIRPTKPLGPERSSRDHVELPRVALRFDRVHYGRLRQLIDALNELVS